VSSFAFLYIKWKSILVRIRFLRIYLPRNDFLVECINFAISSATPKLYFLAGFSPSDSNKLYSLSKYSNSELFQDLFVADKSNYKQKGFFVEFGAMNGFENSNTFMLEQQLNWSGILVEPSIKFQKELSSNRKRNRIDNRLVFSVTGQELLFNETVDSGLSTIDSFTESDSWNRISKDKYYVTSISLEDLLKEHEAPNKIDYLSIDTEGSELEILSNFNFSRYEINIITVEHNYSKNRKRLQNLLEEKGYVRHYEKLSKWDDWYIHSRIEMTKNKRRRSLYKFCI
jgi:FkbM family methyltransferase